MTRWSSNLTVIFKYIIPYLWLFSFGVFGIAMLFAKPDVEPLLVNPFFRWGYLCFYIAFALLFYFTVFKLKRVEVSHEGIFVSNYFKTYKYSYASTESIIKNDYGIMSTIKIVLKNQGNFGKVITFIPKEENLRQFTTEYSDYFSNIKMNIE